ncbi:unnamed protein product [Spirodela intermedia]|uniref:Amino acid transporter transmembrane domain-containing protein n=1 Tax=Spirodela intermedia TaxID=51605 RepID=A0A7I8JE63_SPIIN|nr:unnamed protein product [Spirodela intermedia]CAA6668438.1 unnamed protein product [Spirodela intermedia]
MAEGGGATRGHHHHGSSFSIDLGKQHQTLGPSKCYDDDGRLKRTGTVWTASAHIITAVIGSGVLSLAWAIGQLGWVAGPPPCFSSPPSPTTPPPPLRLLPLRRPRRRQEELHLHGRRGMKVKICGWIQYANIFGVAIGYTIAASISMMAIRRADCFHRKGHDGPCHVSSNAYMIAFGIWWLSIVAAVMSFTYSSIGLALGIAQVVGIKQRLQGQSDGISVGPITQTEKMWRTFQAFGDIAFAYSYSIILIEIQDTVKSPPSEAKTMKRAALLSVAVTTVFYLLCGCAGYAAFGDAAPGNLLTSFGFFEPFWLLDAANAAIVIHLVGAYQVYCQPLFAFVESWAPRRWPHSRLVNGEHPLRLLPGGAATIRVNAFRLLWRTAFVVVTTVISMLLPFFNDVVGFLGALGFWPLTVYFPVEMYINQKRIPRWSPRWVCLQMLSAACLVISAAAAAGSVAGVILDLKTYRPFKSDY